MANLITHGRVMMLVVVVALAYIDSSAWQLANVALIALIALTFLADALDGYVARRRN